MTRAGALVPAATAPSETVRLLREAERAWTEEGTPIAPEQLEPLIDAARAGTFDGLLWVGPKDEAVGLAAGEPPTEVGRRLRLILAEGYRTAPVLDGFLTALESPQGGPGPLLEVEDRIPGTTPDLRGRALRAHGFVAVARIDYIWPPGRAVPTFPPDPTGAERPLRPSDARALGQLLDRAYGDNPIDRALFRRWRDSVADAQAGIDLLLQGGLGPWLDGASFGWESEGRLIAATIANDFHGALITEVMVDPEFRRRGLARRLLARTVAALIRAGREPIRLVVTLSNEGAIRLYRSFGFEPVPATEGSTWLHWERLGLSSMPPAATGKSLGAPSQ